MTTLEMEISIMKTCDIRRNIIVPNVSFGMVRYFEENGKRKFDELHECDILVLNKSGYATEYEIKVSKRDFKADFKKKHNHDSKFIKHLYYVVPYEMLEFAKEYLPEGSGLAYVKDGFMIYETTAPIRKGAFKWTEEERYKLARLGTMRILNLKRNIWKLKQ